MPVWRRVAIDVCAHRGIGLLVLVTGGTGFTGSHLVEALLARGDRVRCLVRSRKALRWLEGLSVELVEGSIEDPAACRAAVEGVDVVHHVAGLIAADEAGFMRANAEGTRNVLEACAEKAKEFGIRKVRVMVKGPGAGRETAIRTLQTAGLDVVSIKDVTPVPHNGGRPKERRRI